MTDIWKEHPELFHYTSGIGLLGILSTQQLRGTSARFLNDAEEQTGYLDRCLPIVVRTSARIGLDALSKNPSGAQQIELAGGIDKAVEIATKELSTVLRETTLAHNHQFVTSFCTSATSYVRQNGLLSQWRGYGRDGGYAIVFDTEQLHKQINEEHSRFAYLYGIMGDVEYYEDNAARARSTDAMQDEDSIRDALVEFLRTTAEESLAPLFEPIARRTCLHKHHGFEEEREVRLVNLLPTEETLSQMNLAGNKKARKPVEFMSRDGLLIPYISVLGRSEANLDFKLPITRIIIGPNTDMQRRKRSILSLFSEKGIEAEIVASEIPYIGR